MGLFAVYCDVQQYINNATANTETASLIGGLSTLRNACIAGDTSLTVYNASAFVPGLAWILDGLNSEIVNIATADTDTGVLIESPGVLAAHAIGVSISQAGISGCLADRIDSASREVENICQQGIVGIGDRTLYSQQRTEVYEAPYGNAIFNVDGSLKIYPYHYPVQSVATIMIAQGAMNPVSLGLNFITYPNGARSITLPFPNVWNNNIPPSFYTPGPLSRNIETQVTVTYTAGPIQGTTLANVPSDVRQACFWLVSDLLGNRQNPQGFAMSRKGDTTFEARLRGDKSGRSILRIYAEDKLLPYIRVM